MRERERLLRQRRPEAREALSLARRLTTATSASRNVPWASSEPGRLGPGQRLPHPLRCIDPRHHPARRGRRILGLLDELRSSPRLAQCHARLTHSRRPRPDDPPHHPKARSYPKSTGSTWRYSAISDRGCERLPFCRGLSRRQDQHGLPSGTNQIRSPIHYIDFQSV
jgi:hypothetical protein